MSGPKLPYRRTKLPRQFAESRVLDINRLRNLWNPWLNLKFSRSSHHLANSAPLTADLLGHSREDILGRPWAQVHAPAGLRNFVLRQCRILDDPLKNFLNQLEQPNTTEDINVLGILALRTSLTLGPSESFNATFVSTGKSYKSANEHLLFEHAKLERTLHPMSSDSIRTHESLLLAPSDKVVALLAAVNLSTYALRIQNSRQLGDKYLASGNTFYQILEKEDDWLSIISCNHFRRTLAFKYFLENNAQAAANILARVVLEDTKLASIAKGDSVLEHYWEESHRVMLTTVTRFQSWLGSDEIIDFPKIVDALDELEPFYPESRMAIGDYYKSQGYRELSYDSYMQAAQGGSIHGAVAAFRAYEVLEGFKNDSRRAQALQLLLDLDPQADIHDEV
jgi:hypothetical protein